MSVRIVDVCEVTKPISSPIRNAYIDFTKMTTSLVAVVTDVVRDGKRVVGYGFNSNGRYGQGGLIRERFAPRLMEADPKSLLDPSGDNLDPDKVWAAMMANEKPGGHGERSVAVGTIDMAVWDAVAKIAGKPLFRLLAERNKREANPRVFVYAAGGYYYPGKDLSMLCAEMRGYLDRGYNVVKMKIGGAPLSEDRARIEAVQKEIGNDAQLAVDASPLRLNKFIREQSQWSAPEIEARGRQLAVRSLSIWPPLKVDPVAVRAAELRELKERASRYNLQDIEIDTEARRFLNKVRDKIMALGDDVIELPGPRTVTYRTFEFFVEIIPRRNRITLLLNLDFDEIDDPSQRATDATEQAFIIHATETGGVLFRVSKDEHIGPAMHLVQQAYDRVSE